jgi:hypothetical protein
MTAIETYDLISKPPEWALKKITGGRLNGKTDIKPQWRYRTMVETFGFCGVGWKYTIDRQWVERGAKDEAMAFVNISLYVKDNGTWSDTIPGTGGSMLVESESKGMHNNDEAFKMALTDALSGAMKFLGMAAAIYSGQWDGAKYSDDDSDPNPQVTPSPNAKGPGESGSMDWAGYLRLVEAAVPESERVEWKRKANGGRDSALLASLAVEIKARYEGKAV